MSLRLNSAENVYFGPLQSITTVVTYLRKGLGEKERR